MDTLTVPGTLDSLTTIRSFVDRVSASADLDRRTAYRLRLAIDEIATNIANYGYARAERSGEIRIEAVTDSDWLTITLEDTGVRFDPTEAALPDNLSDPLEERPIGGLGIFLTVTGIDDFRYQHVDGRNRNVFAMRRPSAATAGPTS
jgi:anti-sigma regulatory factor (Ser/Thr protein kinase)